VAAITLPAANA